MKNKRFLCFLLAFLIICYQLTFPHITRADSFPLVVLSTYQQTLQVGDEFPLLAVTSNGKRPTFHSSNSKVASVNSYGLVTAKSPGSTKITAKISGAEGSCRITVSKTEIRLNYRRIALEHGEHCKLSAETSTGHLAVFRTNKKSVATVDPDGTITAQRPGEALITVSCDKTSVTCKVVVKRPIIRLDKTRIRLYRGQTFLLTPDISSHLRPKFRSNRKSVALVSDTGRITAVKHGYALITVSLDGVSKICEVTVESPTICLNASELTLNLGQTYQLKADVSSGATPAYSSSNSNVASVNKDGMIRTHKCGSAIITVSEDGTKERCRITVTK